MPEGSAEAHITGLTGADDAERTTHRRRWGIEPPQKLIAQGTDWRFFSEPKREPKG